MADLRIVDAPEIPTASITGEEKLPTGGNGNYSISLDSLADYTKTKKDLVDNITVDGKVNGVRQELNTHIEDLLNPHQVTKGQIGLSNVDNTADADKPVSNSTQATIISAVAPKSDKTYVDGQLTLKANKADVYTKSETYTKQESSDLVSSSISTALTPINTSLDLAKRGVANRYDSLLTYNSGERVVLANGDIVKSTINGNTNDPDVDMAGWVKTNSASQIFDESGLSQQELNKGFESIADLLAISNPKNRSRVYVKSYLADQGKGGKFFTFDVSRVAENDGGLCINGWVAEYKERYTIEDFGGICDFNLDSNTGYDNADAIEKSLAALDYALFTAPTGTSKPVIMKSGQSLLRTNTDDYVAKTTNELGTGSNLAPNRTSISDSYAVDAGVILKHADNQYTTDVNISIDIIHTAPTPTSIGIYAPRFYFCNFVNKVFRFGTSIKSFDGFKSRVGVQAIAPAIGFKWEDDGSGSMTGTTVDFSDSWVAFDENYQTPVAGFDLYQLWYSTATNLSVDNGTSGITAYKFSNCKSIEFTGGAENNKGCLIDCLNSSVTFDGFKTAAHTGDSNASNATIKAVGSILNMANSTFDPTTGATGMKDIICDGSNIDFSKLQSKPSGAGGEVISNNGCILEQSGPTSKVKIGDSVFQVRDCITQKKSVALTGYNGIFKVTQSTPLFLRLSITVSSASGSMHKEIDILYLNGTTRDVKIVSTSTVGTIADFSLDFDVNGNVFLVSSGATSARFSIDCKDTYIQGESGNFIDVY